MNSFEAIRVTLLQNQITSLQVALEQSQQHNSLLIRHNEVLSELAANKTAYAEQMRQALNGQRAGNHHVKVSSHCDGCRYLKTAEGRCAAFGWPLETIALDPQTGRYAVVTPKSCTHGPYQPRPAIWCAICGELTDHSANPCPHLDYSTAGPSVTEQVREAAFRHGAKSSSATIP